MRLRICGVFLALSALALVSSLLAPAPASAAEPSSAVQQQIRAATFEVVQLKPADGEVTYDREPPMDLIPFQQRTDKYRSIGTAFAIGSNRYVTAAHVLHLGLGSQFGPPLLRDAAGNVYDIDQVFKYSDSRDFAVFSLRVPLQGAKSLSPGGKPALNTTVYAVGNALGEGVIIRDGVYTSDTPEELDGKWKWLRFSAAASPGNSGGPLVDGHGKVVGVVLRKSPAENLNIALPIAELLDAKENEGRLGGRLPVRLPIVDASETLRIDERFDLPLKLAQLYTTVLDLSVKQIWDANLKLLEHNAQHLFPRGAGSERLLNTVERAIFPQLMHEDPNKIWVAVAPKIETVHLDRNGFVEETGGFVRLRAPDGVGLKALYADDKLYMDLLLKAHVVRRVVGSDSVRVTSLGKPKSASHFSDRWGRTWQVRDWAIPYDDEVLTAVSLPMPDGYVALLVKVNSGYIDAVHKSQQLLCDYLYLTMVGTLSQWQDYLAQTDVQPKAFAALKIKIDPQKEVVFHSDRFELTARPELLQLAKDTLLFLDFGFAGEGDTARWDVKRVVFSEGAHTKNLIWVARGTAPPASLPDTFQNNWIKLRDRSFPYNGLIESQNGETRISTSVQPPGAAAAHVRYALGITREGTQTQRDMTRKLEPLQRSFTIMGDDGR